MNINDLPTELFIKIFDNFFSIKECDIEYNLNLRLVCKYWNKIINKNLFCNLYSKNIFFDIKDNIRDNFKISYYNYVKMLNDNIIKNIKYNENNKINKFKYK